MFRWHLNGPSFFDSMPVATRGVNVRGCFDPHASHTNKDIRGDTTLTQKIQCTNIASSLSFPPPDARLPYVRRLPPRP